jgi:hypothetical protein
MVREPYSNMDVVVKGEFILPDGTVVPKQLVEYVASEQDAEKERIEVKFRAWVEGFRSQGAEALDTRPINVWEYEWPAWQFYTRMSATQAPADISMRLRSPSGSVRYLEELEIDWKVPAGIKVLENDRDDARVIRAEEPGTYPIEVTVSDGRGYVSELVHEVVVNPADPWEVNFRLSKSNDLNRAPLELRFIPDVGGGHPRDRLKVHRYYLDGQMITEGERYASMTLAEGTYDLGLEIESKFGEVVRYTEELKVLPNLVPECTLEARQASTNWRFKAECEDQDGYVADHVWVVDGEPLAMSGSRISVSVRETGQLSVSVKAIDNGKAESQVETWSGIAQAPDDREDDDRDDQDETPGDNPETPEPDEPKLPNEPPVCALDERKWGDGMRFSVDCDDPDGRMADYKWTVNGEPMSESDTRIVVNADPGVEVTVEFKGVDDRGDASSTQTWSGIVNPEKEDKAEGGENEKPEDKDNEQGDGQPDSANDPELDENGNAVPECTLSSRRSGSGQRFKARCDDKDGYVMNHIWTVNGVAVDTNNSRLNVEVKTTQSVSVTLKGVDDRGAESQMKSWEGTIKP